MRPKYIRNPTKEQKKRMIGLQAVTNKKGKLVGFVKGNYEERQKKAEKLKLKLFGYLITTEYGMIIKF